MTLPYLLVEQAVKAGLLEDLGRAGDITSEAVVPKGARAVCTLVTREHGVVAGLDFARTAFALIDPAIAFTIKIPDASRVAPGDVIAEIEGPAGGILTAERVALNFLGHMSGIATATARIADAMRPGRDCPHQGADHLHAQNHARPALRPEIRGTLRRRCQSPVRAG